MAVFDNVTEAIGRTPSIRLHRLAPEGVELYVKYEAMNPLGSVKDRLAVGIIEAAEKSGQLRAGQTVVEATSGNTGIGLAMVCAQRGYPLVIVMAENFSVERRRIMRFLGAKVVLTPAAEKGRGMLAKAAELAEKHGWFPVRQFENEANAEIHRRTTAVEICEDFGDSLDYWVTGFGTGGTLKGVAGVLRERSPKTRIVVCEPENSPIFASDVRLPWPESGIPDESHPLFRPHPVQGWSPDFVPKLAEDARQFVDEIVPMRGADALRLARELATKEGLFVGISAGGTLAGALEIARRAGSGTKILCMLPDTGERYLSTPLFEEVEKDMTAEEIEISRSTPGYQFDVSVAKEPEPEPGAASQPATPAAKKYVDALLANREQPVVLFSLEWCEFCWAVRKLFMRTGIDHRVIELDSVDFQKDDWGGQIRAALRERCGSVTIPQIYVAGQFVGGAMEVFGEYDQKVFQKRLEAAGVSYQNDLGDTLYSLLPGWVQR